MRFFLFCRRSLVAARKFTGAGLFYWAASRHRLRLYWPVSRCVFVREGVSPDLLLPGWSTGRHSWAGVGEELHAFPQIISSLGRFFKFTVHFLLRRVTRVLWGVSHMTQHRLYLQCSVVNLCPCSSFAISR